MAESATPRRAASDGKASRKGSGSQQGGGSGKGGPKGRRTVGGTLLTLLKGGVIALAICIIAGTAVFFIGYQTTEIPDPNADFQTNVTTLTFRDGETPLGTLQVQNRVSIPYEEMPQSIKDAVIAAENRDFWTDKGFSIQGMVRSAWAILNGGELQGGSTITQQYIKIYYLDQTERTLTRKFTELILAVKMSRQVPKEQILESYLNTIYFGRGAYGVQAAAKAYFDVDAKDLTVQQSAVLAAVLNNPGMFDPAEGENNSARLLERYRYIIDGMVETGQLNAAQGAEYRKELPEFPEIPTSNRFGGPNGFLINMAKQELLALGFSESEVNGGGLQVVTTFDAKSQAAAVAAAQKYEKTAEENNRGDGEANLHAALASVDVETGAVRALYGGPDFVENSRNWATTPRASASTFKTYALAAGLKDGFSLRDTFRGSTFRPEGDDVPVRNEFSHQYGPVSLLRATALSVNTAFVDMTTQMDDGPQKIIDAATAAGVPTNDGPGWFPGSRISLGTAEISPMHQAAGYAAFANAGKQVSPHVIQEVRDRDGKVLLTVETGNGEQAFDADIAADVTYAMSNVVEAGSGRNVSTLGRPVAGKTGTASGGPDESEVHSSWFVGYTAQISTAVMFVAGDGGNEDLHPYRRSGDGTFYGGTYPALTFAEYMEKASEGMEVKEFPEPAWVNRGRRAPETTRAPVTRQPTTQPPSTTRAPSSSSPPTSEPPTSEPPTSSAPPETTEPPQSSPPPPPTTSKAPEPSNPPTQPTSEPTGGGGGEGGGNGGGESAPAGSEPSRGGG
ncbi:transglycosylase domain-containing protein [Propionibacteriaceae bacterium Y2011]|uniref:transglycosylase domain-containing protein n=1 Tax=Microlunatus sp. Y2014 TaxID=3418488 RepID=UPI003B496876